VYEGVGQTFCQFTFACDGATNQTRIAEDWRSAQVLAARVLAGEGQAIDDTDGATYFHTVAVHPTWAPRMQRVTQIGNHIFYREKTAALGVLFRGAMR
jgi:spore germination cell wall hydrolase CwlJ-like protein